MSSSSSAAPGDRRARGRERRRAALLATALELFIEKGYESTTMDDIADRADVARATVFNYFPRKVTFVEEWAASRRRRAADAAALADDSEGSSLRGVLVRYFTEMAAMSIADRAESVALLNAAVPSTSVWSQSPLAAELSRFVAQACAKGEVDQDTDPDRVGRLLASSHFATLVAWVGNDPPPFELTEEVIATVDLVLSGIMRVQD